jgi:hypothetical protein
LKLNYHMLLLVIGGTILLMAIGGYFINWYWKLLMVFMLMAIGGYWWLFY